MENLKALDEVIHTELEPGVINKEMINLSYRSDGHKGEAGRLQLLEEIDYGEVDVIRLEFKNILRIDHLWVLPNLTKLSLSFNKLEVIENINMLKNLKELDLSFNYIERIENLDELIHLETLSLCSNLITKIENLDNLENLIILSLAHNKIESFKGIERFRFFKHLKVLNLEGNAIAQDPVNPLRIYIAALLPDLSYYAYVYIEDAERNVGIEKYKRELREIATSEEGEKEARAKRAKEQKDEIQLSSSFVEYLNEDQLFDSFWDGDDDGFALRQIGEDADDLIKEYRSDVFNITQEIYKLGLEKFVDRQKELDTFFMCMEESQNEAQQEGQSLIENFQIFKDSLFKHASVLFKKLELASIEGMEEQSPEVRAWNEEIEKLSEAFDMKIDEVWQQLMESELHLNESVEETTTNFSRNIQEMMSKFVEQVQTYFVQLRDVTVNFSDNLVDAVSHYISIILATGQFGNVAPELKDCLEDKDAVMNLVDGMRDTHMQRIDGREDRLMTRSRDWLDGLVNDINRQEIERNRLKIVEINYFLEKMRDAFGNLQSDIREQLLNEHS